MDDKVKIRCPACTRIFGEKAGRIRDGTATSEHAAAKALMVRPLAAVAWSFACAAGG